MLDTKEIGKRIGIIRTNEGLTAEAFAEYLNISVRHVFYLEAGKRRASLSLAVQIAETFQISLDYLLFGDGDMKRGTKKAEQVVHSAFHKGQV